MSVNDDAARLAQLGDDRTLITQIELIRQQLAAKYAEATGVLGEGHGSLDTVLNAASAADDALGVAYGSIELFLQELVEAAARLRGLT